MALLASNTSLRPGYRTAAQSTFAVSAVSVPPLPFLTQAHVRPLPPPRSACLGSMTPSGRPASPRPPTAEGVSCLASYCTGPRRLSFSLSPLIRIVERQTSRPKTKRDNPLYHATYRYNIKSPLSSLCNCISYSRPDAAGIACLGSKGCLFRGDNDTLLAARSSLSPPLKLPRAPAVQAELLSKIPLTST